MDIEEGQKGRHSRSNTVSSHSKSSNEKEKDKQHKAAIEAEPEKTQKNEELKIEEELPAEHTEHIEHTEHNKESKSDHSSTEHWLNSKKVLIQIFIPLKIVLK